MKRIVSFLFILCCSGLFSQDNFTSKELAITPFVEGNLVIPNNSRKPVLAIIIPGSGPTDRNGNQNFLKSNSLKKLAEALAQNGIASYRYDKRVLVQLRKQRLDKNTNFDDFIDDAKVVIKHFKSSENYSKIYVIGHSQGSLVGMVAGQGIMDGFISLAGAGNPIDQVIEEQVTNTWPAFTEDTKRILGEMRKGKTTTDFPPAMGSIFNLEVQPFLISWMAYNPQEEIKKLDMPMLIINGTKDLQVSESEAKLLHESANNSTLKIIDNMNHVLFIIEGDELENTKSYNESFRTLPDELITSIVDFIRK